MIKIDYGNITERQKNIKISKDRTPHQPMVAAKEKKPNELAKDVQSFKDTMINSVLVPALQRTAMELVRATCQQFTKAIEKRIFGREVFGDSLWTNAPLGSKPRTNYNKVSSVRSSYSVVESPSRSRYDLKDLGFSSYNEAKQVLNQLIQDLEEFTVISAGEYYEYCGIAPDYTDYKYGWYNLSTAKVVPNRNGDYSIKFPVPRLLLNSPQE